MQYAVKSQKHTATVAITAMIIIKRAALFMAARSLFLSRNGMVSGFAVHSRRQKLRVPCTKHFATLADRLNGLDQPTVWQEFSPLSVEYGSVNLGQGFPDWNPPGFVIEAMQRSTNPKFGRNANQYARSYAHMPLAEVLAEDYSKRWNIDIDPASQISTASGVTNILYCALQGLVNPGDEVLLLEPAFDIYASQVKMAGGKCVYCPLRPDFAKEGASQVFSLDLEELRSKITDKTKVIMLNTPHNPTGKMFSRQELQGIAEIVLDHPNLVVFSDEVYEHIVFDKEKEPHLSIAMIDGMWDRTLTMSSSGKTFSCTGWKVGWAVGPPSLIKAVTAVQQWVNYSSATPTQDAIAQALVIAREPYEGFANFYDYVGAEYDRKRKILQQALESAGMDPVAPPGERHDKNVAYIKTNTTSDSLFCLVVAFPGAFFIMADTSHVEFPYEEMMANESTPAMPVSPMPRDWALSRWLTREVGVTAM